MDPLVTSSIVWVPSKQSLFMSHSPVQTVLNVSQVISLRELSLVFLIVPTSYMALPETSNLKHLSPPLHPNEPRVQHKDQ